MARSSHFSRIKFVLIFILIILGIITLIYNQHLISTLRERERSSIELWAKAIQYNGTPQNVESREDIRQLIDEIELEQSLSPRIKRRWGRLLNRIEGELANTALDFVASELIINNRFNIPSIVTDSSGIILYARNVEEGKTLSNAIEQFRLSNAPILISVGSGKEMQRQYVYYGDSQTIQILKYFPFIQFGFLLLFVSLAYWSWSSIKSTEQSNLWVGMAKEAAHQLGTPLSSMYGWVALMREMDLDEQLTEISHELNRDIERLQKVSERFNKIGSSPELEEQRIGTVLHLVLDYMEKRLPRFGKNVELRREIETATKLPVNIELFEWAIENLIKNAFDALEQKQGYPFIEVRSFITDNKLVVEVEDSGKGMPKKVYEQIFRPGFSTKRRGWGLGLSLTKRIIEEYHKGKLMVAKSQVDVGTTMRIELIVPTKRKDV